MTPRLPLAPIARRPDPAPRSDRVEQIVGAARHLVETEGAEALTMRRMGSELGIKAPSLYKHVAGRDAVVAHLVDDALLLSGDLMHGAVDGAVDGDAVATLLTAYRGFGRAHPNLYRLATSGTLPRAALTDGLEGWAGEPFLRVTGDPYRGQALWAFAHGGLVLELDGRYVPGSDLDRTWQAGARAFTADQL